LSITVKMAEADRGVNCPPELSTAAVTYSTQNPPMDGVTLLACARALYLCAVRMMLSAAADFSTVPTAVNLAEAFLYIPEPRSGPLLASRRMRDVMLMPAGWYLRRPEVRMFREVGVKIAAALFGVAMLVPLADVSAQGFVPGPWGDLKDHVKPLEISTDLQRVTLYRRQHMLAQSAHFRAIEAVVIYRAPFAAELTTHARALQGLARNIDKLFVPGTETEPGRHGAKPEIWQQSERFGQHVAGFRKAVDELVAATQSGSDVEAAYTGVRHQCLACHQSFRIFKPQPKPAPL
jgi:cytochrome c556